MKVSKDNINHIFKSLINGNITRDEAENWAMKCMQESDNRNLEYENSELENVLWEAIIYLSGVGMMTSPNIYLDNVEDIKAEYEERWKHL